MNELTLEEDFDPNEENEWFYAEDYAKLKVDHPEPFLNDGQEVQNVS